MKFFVPGLVLGLIAVPLAAWIYFNSSVVPVATADHPLPFETAIAGRALDRRIDRDMPKTVPIEANATNLEAGAHIYRQQCAFCHGLYGTPSGIAQEMFPFPTQLWQTHGRRHVVGVSDDPPPVTYWKVANGIRLSGMPAFNKVLNDTQMWQVSLLVANADHPLPEVLTLVKQPLDLDPPPQ